ncbi:MAG TPA: CPBP family intramembrane glutamic endopeptidase [Longimicrobiales bacterium]|nr:CPBP family intramembrane glutamic endopeptidase [Longimicrobiales bacterium]
MRGDLWARLFAPRHVLGTLGRLVLFVIALGVAGAAFGLLARMALARLPGAGGTPEGAWQLTLSALTGLLAALVAGWVVLAVMDRRPPGALGFAWTRATPRQLAIGLGIGAAAQGVAVLVILAAGRLAWVPDAGTAGGYALELLRDLAIFGVAAAAEEALFRGYPLQVLTEGFGPVVATVVLSGAFALAHRNNPNVDAVALVNIFLAGVLLSIAYLRTRSLWFATAVHVGWNWAMATLFALPVSGLSIVDTPLYDARLGGPRWLTGGAFGPEAGIAGAVGFVAALAGVALLPGLREDPELRALRPLVDSRFEDAR